MARRPGGGGLTLLEPQRIYTPREAPVVWLLDAGSAGVDEQVLRASARALTAESRASYVSRSYRYPYALVAWHRTSVGIDIERVEPLDAGFTMSICTPAERVEWTGVFDPHAHVSSLWSSKEALAKALGDPVVYDPRRLGSPMFWPEGRSGCWRATTLQAAPRHVAWLCWRAMESGSLAPRRIS